MRWRRCGALRLVARHSSFASRRHEAARIDRAYRLLYGRPAKESEARLGLAFLGRGDDRPARWQEYAQVLLAANEMLFVD